MFVTFAQGRLNELMSQIRMQNHFGTVRSEERYSVDADLLREIRQVSCVTSLCRHRVLWIALRKHHLQLFSHLSALEAAAGRYKSFDQRHQRRLGRHQTHRARTQRRWAHEGGNSKLSTRHHQNPSVLQKMSLVFE